MQKLSLICLFTGMALLSLAQITSGKVSYSMEFSSDDPNMAMALPMIQGSKMDLSFVPDKSKGEVSMGAIGTVTVIADTKTKQALTLMNMMGKKTAIESTMDAQPPKGEELPDYDVEVTNETKMILGYKCTKAIMTAEDGTVMTGWFTKEIAAPTEGQKYYNAQMPGFPLSFNVTMDGMNVQIMATAFDKKAPAKSVFDMKVPEGYEVQTMEEFQRSVSGQ